MRIRMTATAKGAVTSTEIREFAEGSEHDLPEDLAEAFLSMGVAEAVAPAPADPGPDPEPAVTMAKPRKGRA